MNGSIPDKKQTWSGTRSVSNLTASGQCMSNVRKKIIYKALELDIIDIRSYSGYKGDMLIEITTIDNDIVAILEQTAKTLGLEVVIQQDSILLFKVFVISSSSDIYDLK